MINKMQKVQTEKWARRQAYATFIGYSVPVFSLSARLDVTKLCQRCRREKTSFFGEMLYIVSAVLNGIEEFRLRLHKGDVVLFDKTDPNYIVMADSGAITPCRTEYTQDRKAFLARERADITYVKENGGKLNTFNPPGVVDCFYVSTLPWTDILSISNPYDYMDADGTSIPRVTWGKYSEENGRMKMTIDIAAHHALIDGEPVCRAFNAMQRMIDEIDE